MEGMISALSLNNRYDVDKYRDGQGGGKLPGRWEQL